MHPRYVEAFHRISAGPNDTLYVAELGGEGVGTIQTTLIVSIIGRGSSSLTLEAARRARTCGAGIGEAMVRFAVAEARRNGARLVQLMSNAAREDAHRFYGGLGFARSHVDFNMKLEDMR